ncbi:uncharacterized protein JN550_012224 [Neoarthrinium moseri]|uniref:uncharacterized protein n=1 Tax=Neoarthrinium moseri TaxID=1658444 RepID=UPI001FDBD35A|nr:uncharacterized protein JN550_012224 [Neoarthrinium moseri]KAI1859211.1 hypothetical protein JN550_012224 [Neoarthrinium moseri]
MTEDQLIEDIIHHQDTGRMVGVPEETGMPEVTRLTITTKAHMTGTVTIQTVATTITTTINAGLYPHVTHRGVTAPVVNAHMAALLRVKEMSIDTHEIDARRLKELSGGTPRSVDTTSKKLFQEYINSGRFHLITPVPENRNLIWHDDLCTYCGGTDHLVDDCFYIYFFVPEEQKENLLVFLIVVARQGIARVATKISMDHIQINTCPDATRPPLKVPYWQRFDYRLLAQPWKEANRLPFDTTLHQYGRTGPPATRGEYKHLWNPGSANAAPPYDSAWTVFENEHVRDKRNPNPRPPRSLMPHFDSLVTRTFPPVPPQASAHRQQPTQDQRRPAQAEYGKKRRGWQNHRDQKEATRLREGQEVLKGVLDTTVVAQERQREEQARIHARQNASGRSSMFGGVQVSGVSSQPAQMLAAARQDINDRRQQRGQSVVFGGGPVSGVFTQPASQLKPEAAGFQPSGSLQANVALPLKERITRLDDEIKEEVAEDDAAGGDMAVDAMSIFDEYDQLPQRQPMIKVEVPES